jgi:hypothetical protein
MFPKAAAIDQWHGRAARERLLRHTLQIKKSLSNRNTRKMRVPLLKSRLKGFGSYS